MPDPSTITITRARPRDGSVLSRALGAAFHRDPVFGWLIPDPDDRRERLPEVFAAFVDLYLPYNETYLTGDGSAAALWAPAGSQPFEEQDLVRLGERLAAILGDDASKALELDAILEENHPDEPAYFLHFMGVVPEHQGRGLGSRLLETVLDRCDASRTPSYLDATSPDNRRLYQRHGFETITQVDVPDGGPSLWTMWREPQGEPT